MNLWAEKVFAKNFHKIYYFNTNFGKIFHWKWNCMIEISGIYFCSSSCSLSFVKKCGMWIEWDSLSKFIVHFDRSKGNNWQTQFTIGFCRKIEGISFCWKRISFHSNCNARIELCVHVFDIVTIYRKIISFFYFRWIEKEKI